MRPNPSFQRDCRSVAAERSSVRANTASLVVARFSKFAQAERALAGVNGEPPRSKRPSAIGAPARDTAGHVLLQIVPYSPPTLGMRSRHANDR